MSFKDININFNYRSDENDITRDFYIPVLHESRKYKRAVGYFSTSALLKMSVGLVEMERNNGKRYTLLPAFSYHSYNLRNYV